jgi:hypothetical protein
MNPKNFLLPAAMLVLVGASAYLLLPSPKISGPARQEAAQAGSTAPLPQLGAAASSPAASAVESAKSQESPGLVRAERSTAGAESPAGTIRAENLPAAAGNGPLTTAEPEGERTLAKISSQGVERTMTPNEIGHFPRVYIKPSQEVPVELTFPEGRKDDPVAVQLEDGGGLDGRLAAKVYKLDDLGKVAFKFRASAEEGVYRVVVRKDADVRVLDFWVGTEQPVAKR